MLPLYILTLGIAAGLTGAFVRRLAADQGFVPDFETGVTVAVGAACGYMAIQLLYMAFLKLLKPNRGGTVLVSEALSHSAALLLLPYLLQLPVPWPHRILFKVEPLLYLAIFSIIHIFFKLTTLFSATQTRPTHRLGVLGWALACALCAYGAQEAGLRWQHALGAARLLTVPAEEKPCRIGNTYAMARRAPEDVLLRFDLTGRDGQLLTLRWANTPQTDPPLESIHVTVETDGTAVHSETQLIELLDGDWTETRSTVPAGATQCTISWSIEKASAWTAIAGLQPVTLSGRELLLGGPAFHDARAKSNEPNLILLAVEGIGTDHMGLSGYRRAATTSLDALAARGVFYENAYTPSPDAPAACMTLLTGTNPLVHGYLGAQAGPLPEGVQTLPEVLREHRYATAAFTEGEGPVHKDLFFGSGFERGFECFDPAYPMVQAKATPGRKTPAPWVPAGSKITLNKAADWIQEHRGEKFLAVLRLRELRSPQRLARYGEGFLGRGRTPTPMDIYDTALLDLDKQLGAFFDRIKTIPGLSNTCIVLAGTYGFDFSEPGRGTWRRGGDPKRTLTEFCLRVPLFVLTPDGIARQRRGLVALEDVAPTLLNLVGATFSHPVTGKDLLAYDGAGERVSMLGDPLALSLRTQDWRFTWQSGRAARSMAPVGEEGVLQFINITRYRMERLRSTKRNLQNNPAFSRQFRQKLSDYCLRYAGAAQQQQANP